MNAHNPASFALAKMLAKALAFIALLAAVGLSAWGFPWNLPATILSGWAIADILCGDA